MERRSFLAITAAALAARGATPARAAADKFGGTTDWKQQSGKTLNVCAPGAAAADAKDFLAAVKTSLDTAVILPANDKFFELMDPLRVAIQQVILRSDTASSALDSVNTQWQKILA